MTDIISQIDDQYVTNDDGSGFDYANKCSNGGAGGGNLNQAGEIDGAPTGLSDWSFECCGLNPHRFPLKTSMNSCCFDDISPLGAC